MKLIIKQILIIAWAMITIVAVGFSIYTGWTKVKDNLLKQGAVNITQQIVNGAKITYPEGVIIFIPNQ